MAPEHETRARVLYDHESDEPRRRRHAVADWGVGEDIFDRMPSRRFARADRRAEHRETRFERRDDAAGSRELGPGESRTIVIERTAPAEAPPRGERRASSVDAMPPADEPAPARTFVIETAAPADEAPASDRAAAEPPARRTVLIKGHPEALPMARASRPPRTAIERVGTSPDRIVAYAVALGFLLVLIAVLTTGQ